MQIKLWLFGGGNRFATSVFEQTVSALGVIRREFSGYDFLTGLNKNI